MVVIGEGISMGKKVERKEFAFQRGFYTSVGIWESSTAFLTRPHTEQKAAKQAENTHGIVVHWIHL